MSHKSSIGRQYSSAGAWEKQLSSDNWPISPNELKPSLSDPALASSYGAAVVVMFFFKCIFLNCCFVVNFRRINIFYHKCSCFQKTNGQSYQSSYQSQKSMRTQVKRQSTYSVSNSAQMSVSNTGFIQPPSAQSQLDGKMGTIKIPSKLEHSSAYVLLVFYSLNKTL